MFGKEQWGRKKPYLLPDLIYVKPKSVSKGFAEFSEKKGSIKVPLIGSSGKVESIDQETEKKSLLGELSSYISGYAAAHSRRRKAWESKDCLISRKRWAHKQPS